MKKLTPKEIIHRYLDLATETAIFAGSTSALKPEGKAKLQTLYRRVHNMYQIIINL
jgi:hypothetical protein